MTGVYRITRLQALALALTLALAAGLWACSAPQRGGDDASWRGVEIIGRVTLASGEPVSGAYVYAYGRRHANTLGPADAMSEPTGDDGSYSLVLPAGEYTLVARRRRSGSISGPMKAGDLSGRFTDMVLAGRRSVGNISITVHTFSQGAGGDPKRVLATGTRLEGRIVDTAGNPVAGAYAFAYSGPARQGTPDYMSEPTSADGRFRLSLPAGGDFAVGARTGRKGKPAVTDLFGFAGGSEAPIHISEDDISTGLTIIVTPYGDRL